MKVGYLFQSSSTLADSQFLFVMGMNVNLHDCNSIAHSSLYTVSPQFLHVEEVGHDAHYVIVTVESSW